MNGPFSALSDVLGANLEIAKQANGRSSLDTLLEILSKDMVEERA